MRKLLGLVALVLLTAAFKCNQNVSPECLQCVQARPAAECVQICVGQLTPTTQPTVNPTVAPTSTLTPTSEPVATPTLTHPTDPPAAYYPPTAAFVNGCNAGDPNSVSPATGKCEFNIWQKISIPDPAHFTPPCDPGQCPNVWRPAGMGIACDHMFADPGVPAAVQDPKTGKWVTIMYYVCSGRLADFPGDFDVHAVYPSHDCKGSETGNCVSWTPRTWRPDGYNGTIAGVGDYVVCLPADAYTCKDAKDLDDPNTYVTGICASGKVPLPGAGSCAGPYHVNR